jgi:hypothetical protein
MTLFIAVKSRKSTRAVAVVHESLEIHNTGPKSQGDSDPIKYRRVLVSTLLHAFVHDFATFTECTGTDCK